MDPYDWVAEKLKSIEGVEPVGRTQEGFLLIKSDKKYTFPVAVLGVQKVIGLADVTPLFAGATKPLFVINVPSKTLWSGEAIRHIHGKSAAFGTLGDISRAGLTGNAGLHRDRNMGFFINAISQHSNVSLVSYVYDTVFKVDRKVGASLTVAIIDTYNMSAEDVRNARDRLGAFDLIGKSSSYGSITRQAEEAAESIGSEALTFRDLMRRLGK